MTNQNRRRRIKHNAKGSKGIERKEERETKSTSDECCQERGGEDESKNDLNERSA